MSEGGLFCADGTAATSAGMQSDTAPAITGGHGVTPACPWMSPEIAIDAGAVVAIGCVVLTLIVSLPTAFGLTLLGWPARCGRLEARGAQSGRSGSRS